MGWPVRSARTTSSPVLRRNSIPTCRNFTPTSIRTIPPCRSPRASRLKVEFAVTKPSVPGLELPWLLMPARSKADAPHDKERHDKKREESPHETSHAYSPHPPRLVRAYPRANHRERDRTHFRPGRARRLVLASADIFPYRRDPRLHCTTR